MDNLFTGIFNLRKRLLEECNGVVLESEVCSKWRNISLKEKHLLCFSCPLNVESIPFAVNNTVPENILLSTSEEESTNALMPYHTDKYRYIFKEMSMHEVSDLLYGCLESVSAYRTCITQEPCGSKWSMCIPKVATCYVRVNSRRISNWEARQHCTNASCIGRRCCAMICSHVNTEVRCLASGNSDISCKTNKSDYAVTGWKLVKRRKRVNTRRHFYAAGYRRYIRFQFEHIGIYKSYDDALNAYLLLCRFTLQYHKRVASPKSLPVPT
jgi:hypothetical protein